MFRWFRPISTHQPRLSWVSVCLVNLLWVCQMFNIFVQTNAVVFTLRRYSGDTRLIALIASLWPAFGFTLGPLCNYLSDRIWTRHGRRRPFIIAGWTGAGIAMACVPFMSGFGALVALLVGHALIIELASPLEPFCMELLPLAQRGRALAMRAVMVQMATLFYFQGLFPLFDRSFILPGAVPWLGGLAVTGEQLIYFTNSAFFFLMVVLLLFGVRETKMPGLDRLKLNVARLNPLAGLRAFLSDVFGDRRWWWIYSLYVFGSANLAGSCWASMSVLLLTEQFGYTKATVALMGLPMTIGFIVALTPFMGWYSDKVPRIPYGILLSLLTGSLALIVWLARTCPPLGLRELPSVGWIFAFGTLAILGGASAYLAIIQLCLAKIRRTAGYRVWINYVFLAMQPVTAVVAWIFIKYGTADGVPSVLAWMVFTQFTSTISTANAVVTGPMLFDFVPRDKMGTISSGLGMLGGITGVILGNLGGLWIFFFSSNARTGDSADYASNYLYQALVGVVAFAIITFFMRAVRQGRVVEYGRLDLSSAGLSTDMGVDPRAEPSPAPLSDR